MTDDQAGARPLSDAELKAWAALEERIAKTFVERSVGRAILALLARCEAAEQTVKRYEEVGLPLPAETATLRVQLAEAEAALARVQALPEKWRTRQQRGTSFDAGFIDGNRYCATELAHAIEGTP